MKLICPFCYSSFTEKDILFRCESLNEQRCAKENDEKLAHYFGLSNFNAAHVIPAKEATLWESLFGKKVPDSMKCNSCSFISHKRICPECHNELPPFFHQAESHIISIVGARNSGKTHYITVLINELLEKGYLLDISTTPQDVGENKNQVTSKRYRNVYQTPLIDQGKELPQTQGNQKDHYPLIYKIVSGQQKWGKNKTLYLTFYDTAGENFNDAFELKRLANYISNSSGIVFLLDVLQIGEVKKELLEKNIRVPKIGARFNDIFYQVVGLLEKNNKIKGAAGQSKIPLAITFSKFDELLKHGMYYRSSDDQYWLTQKYSESEIDDISENIKTLLEGWGENSFVHNVSTRFSNTKYFGVSALGESPIHGKLEDGNVHPYRVMDPLLWILDQLDFSLPKE